MLKLKSVDGLGVLEKERLVMYVEEGTTDQRQLDLGRYAIFGCKFGENGLPFSGRFFVGYWFNKKKLEPGDYVVLYTKHGQRAEKQLSTGKKSHFYYVGMSDTLWNGDIRPVLVQTGAWEFIEEQEFTVEPLKKAASGDDDIPF